MADLDDPTPLTRIRIRDRDNPWLPDAARGPGLAPDEGCRRCELSRTAAHVCMAPQGPLGAPLVVMPGPTQADDAAGKFVVAGYNAVVQHAVRRHASQFRVAWSVGCPSGKDPTSEQVAACRPYLAHELARRPPRVLLMGPVAAEAALGYPFWAERTRRAWTLLDGIPCFLVLAPFRAIRNHHYKKWLDEDVAWAMNASVGPDPDGEVRVLATAAEAAAWLEAVEPGRLLSHDFEYWPKQIWTAPEFQVLCMSLAQDPGRPVVIPGPVLTQVVPQLRRVMEDQRVPKVAQDAKNERHVMWRAFGIEIRGTEWDTLRVSRLVESESPAGLGRQSWLVGMGGFKEAGQVGSEEEDDE